MKRVRVNISKKYGASARQTYKLNFLQEKNDPSFRVLTAHCQAIIKVLSSYYFFINLGLDLGRDIK